MMLYPSKRALSTIEAVLDIAYYGTENPVLSNDISYRQGIPKRYLEQSLQHLVRDGILVGVRGPRGGYKLAAHPDAVTLGDILRSIATYEIEADDEAGRSALGVNILRPAIKQIQESIAVKLDEVTLAALCAQARDQGISRDIDQRLDFTI